MFFLLFLVLPNLYVAYRASALLALTPAHTALLWTVMVALFLLQVFGIAGERTIFPHWKESLAPIVPLINWSAYLLYGLMSISFIYFLFGDIVRIVWHLAAMPSDPVAFDRRLFAVVTGAALLTTAIGLYQATAGPTIKRVDVAIKNLPTAFDGYKIVQISDLHTGPTIKRPYTEKVVALANSLNPDAVALTGDFVDGSIGELSPAVEPLKNLRSRDGSFFVTGNHEYYWGGQVWSDHFRSLGINVLANSHAVINRERSAIVIAGVNDPTSGNTDPAAAIAGAPANLVKILLAHQPVTYEKSESQGYDLQLSGHTHGGQYFPFNLAIPFFQKYSKGLYQHGTMQIYVNPGAGYWGPPLRAGVPTEVTLITLKGVQVSSKD